MGVPAFFRWLTEKFPKVLNDVLEKRIAIVEGIPMPLDLTQPNPNGVEYDNLYVDMNGLIHPCSHPEDREAPKTEEEMFLNVTKYVDRLFAAIRPRRLLFLAIDGVAPRAKMNQQRSRRFRAAQDAAERAELKARIMSEMNNVGIDIANADDHKEWDSNVITPGTPFMAKLSAYLWYYITEKVNTNAAWKNIKVIFSDATEPGEGEHKIMKFIRCERSQPGYDPNQRHVLHGLDADLIMLALATHETHFSILREQIIFGKRNTATGPSQAQQLLDAEVIREGAIASCENPEDEWIYKKRLQILNIGVFREYLALDFKGLKETVPFHYDIERIYDDFVFMCFFVGNDFLPHLPSLDIRDGALDFLIELYKELLPSIGDYLTRAGGEINLSAVDILLARIGEIEDEVFKRRKVSEDRMEARNANRKETERSQYARAKAQGGAKRTAFESEALKKFAPVNDNIVPITGDDDAECKPYIEPYENKEGEKEAATSALGKRGRKKSPPKKKKKKKGTKNSDEDEEKDEEEIEEEKEADISGSVSSRRQLNKMEAKECIDLRLQELKDEKIDHLKQTVSDNVRLHDSGWKTRYYEDKYKKEDVEQGGGIRRMCLTYVEGLQWVLRYYYQGCPSWSWFYPFHYAPFASDLVNIDEYNIQFEMGAPFTPIEQLLSVLPKESAHALPESVRWLMTDAESPIFDIYNGDVPLDPNGKALSWLWVLLLPFLDENRIKDAYIAVSENMTLEERRLNEIGQPLMFLHQEHPMVKELGHRVLSKYGAGAEKDAAVCEALKMAKIPFNTTKDVKDMALFFNEQQGQGILGILNQPPPRYFVELGAKLLKPPGPSRAFNNIDENNALILTFVFPNELEHKSIQLPGSQCDPPKIGMADMAMRQRNRGRFNLVDLLKNQANKSKNVQYTKPQNQMFDTDAVQRALQVPGQQIMPGQSYMAPPPMMQQRQQQGGGRFSFGHPTGSKGPPIPPAAPQMGGGLVIGEANHQQYHQQAYMAVPQMQGGAVYGNPNTAGYGGMTTANPNAMYGGGFAAPPAPPVQQQYGGPHMYSGAYMQGPGMGVPQYIQPPMSSMNDIRVANGHQAPPPVPPGAPPAPTNEQMAAMLAMRQQLAKTLGRKT